MFQTFKFLVLRQRGLIILVDESKFPWAFNKFLSSTKYLPGLCLILNYLKAKRPIEKKKINIEHQKFFYQKLNISALGQRNKIDKDLGLEKYWSPV